MVAQIIQKIVNKIFDSAPFKFTWLIKREMGKGQIQLTVFSKQDAAAKQMLTEFNMADIDRVDTV